jgi:hypothetical protein
MFKFCFCTLKSSMQGYDEYIFLSHNGIMLRENRFSRALNRAAGAVMVLRAKGKV